VDLDTANRFVICVYALALRRQPSAVELLKRATALAAGQILPEEVLFSILSTKAFEQKKRCSYTVPNRAFSFSRGGSDDGRRIFSARDRGGCRKVERN
jgi:hypothetical protein